MMIFDWFQYERDSHTCRAYFRALLCTKNRSFSLSIIFRTPPYAKHYFKKANGFVIETSVPSANK
jgi:hypothetical protein